MCIVLVIYNILIYCTLNKLYEDFLQPSSVKDLNISLFIIHPMKNTEILTCFQCGTCHASCPSGKYTSLNIRKIVRDSIKKDVSDQPELWMCRSRVILKT